jgi:integrase
MNVVLEVVAPVFCIVALGWAAARFGFIDAAGFKDVRLHDLRRTFGSWQAANGSSELLIGKSLGHRNTRSTAVYARLNLDPVRQSVERATNAMREVVDSARAKREAATKKRKGRG